MKPKYIPFFAFCLVFIFGLLWGWLAGMDFQRGPELGKLLLGIIFIATLALIFSGIFYWGDDD